MTFITHSNKKKKAQLKPLKGTGTNTWVDKQRKSDEDKHLLSFSQLHKSNNSLKKKIKPVWICGKYILLCDSMLQQQYYTFHNI